MGSRKYINFSITGLGTYHIVDKPFYERQKA